MGGMKGVKYRAKKERDEKKKRRRRKEETFYEIKYSRRLTRHQLALQWTSFRIPISIVSSF